MARPGSHADKVDHVNCTLSVGERRSLRRRTEQIFALTARGRPGGTHRIRGRQLKRLGTSTPSKSSPGCAGARCGGGPARGRARGGMRRWSRIRRATRGFSIAARSTMRPEQRGQSRASTPCERLSRIAHASLRARPASSGPAMGKPSGAAGRKTAGLVDAGAAGAGATARCSQAAASAQR